MTAEAVLGNIKELESLDTAKHWFCRRHDGAGKTADSEDDVIFRQRRVAQALMIFSFDGDQAETYKTTLANGITRNLSRCEVCIAGYYKCKKRLLDGLREEGYEDEQIDIFGGIFDDQAIARIERGLARALKTLKDLTPHERRPRALSRSELMSICEALYCDKFLRDERRLADHFDEPFALCQENERISITTVTPALSRFAFSKHAGRRAWALAGWSHLPLITHAEDFEFSMRPAISQALASARIIPNPDPEFGVQFWTAIQHIIPALSPNLITHSLRNMDVDVCRLVLDYLNQDAPTFAPLMHTITCLLQHAPKDFWDAVGAVSPQSIIEGVFHNPQYDRTILAASDDRSGDLSTVEYLLSWVRPFMESVPSSNQPPACRTLTTQLLERFQEQRYPVQVRERLQRAGINVLKWTLLIRLGNHNATSDAVGRAVGSDLLVILSRYLDHFLKIVTRRSENQIPAAVSDPCRELIQAALTLECRLLRIDHQTLSKVSHLSETAKRQNLEVWQKIVAHVSIRDTALIEAALPATMELSDLGQFGPKGDAAFTNEKTHFNAQFKDCINLMCRVFEQIGEMPPHALRQFVCNDRFRPAFTAALLSSEDQLYEATIEIIKNMSGAAVRQDAIRQMLESGLAGALGDFATAISRVRDSRRFYACPRMLKTAGDLVNILCDPHDGLLRGTNLDPDTQRQVLKYWTCQWNALAIIYNYTEAWSVEQNRELMKEFCRDTMQFTETLFDNYVVFANVLTQTDSKGATASQQLLAEPSNTMGLMVIWLRLKDEYLAAKAVAIIPSIISKLKANELSASPRVYEYLLKVVTGNTKTILTVQQKAELGKAIQFDNLEQSGDDELSIVEVRDREKIPSAGLQQKLPSSKLGQTSKLRPGQTGMKDWLAKARTSGVDTSGSVASGSEKREAIDSKSKVKPALPQTTARALPPALKKEPKAKPDIEAFMKQRNKEKLEKQQRNQAAIAKLKNQDTTSLSGQLAGAGSALAGLGNLNKDRTRKSGDLMVSSGEESSDDDNDFNQVLFGAAPKSSTATVTETLRQRPAQPPGPVKKVKQQRSAKQMKARLAPSLEPLHRQILAWDLFQPGDFPPGSTRTDYTLVTESFRTPDDYKHTFQPLLLLEAWQGFQQAKEEGWGKPLSIKVGSRLSVDGLVEINVVLEMTEFKDLGIGETDILLLSRDKTPDTSSGRCLARVQRLGKRKPTSIEVSIRVSPESNSLLSSLASNSEVFGFKITSLTPLEREYGALLGLEYYDLCDEITRAIPSPLLNYSQDKIQKICRMYDLNQAQAKAVQSAVDNDAFTLIQGPPGSGKTKTIISIVGALLTDVLRRPGGTAISQPQQTGAKNQPVVAPKKLLVCAPSNAAVDELVMRLMDGVKTYSGEKRKISVVRLGRSDRINAKVAGVTLDELVNQKLEITDKPDQAPDELKQAMDQHKAVHEEILQLRSVFDEARASDREIPHQQKVLMEKLNNRKKGLSTRIDNLKDSGNTRQRDADLRRTQVQQEILNSADVLCATLSGSGHNMFQRLSIDFETVVIDEAAQSVELSALIPLKYGCQKCIMVGDPKQLPPTVLSREAARFQYEQSLFVRMQSNRPNDVHLLDTQYRMHPEISMFPSQTFYDGRLLDGDDMAGLRRKEWHQDAYLGPYQFFDVQGTHQSGPKGHSLVNPVEVEVAVQLYQRLRRTAKDYDFTSKVGIITPYKSQLQRLRQRFDREYGPDIFKIIDFNTTDAFQGREAEVIIFSCVRASNKGIGFLSDIRRMNVGITRAKCSLWVLGNATSLQQGEYWRKLIVNARERGRLTGGDVSKLIKGPPKTATGLAAPKPATVKQEPGTVKSEFVVKEEPVTVKQEFALKKEPMPIKPGVSEFADKMDIDLPDDIGLQKAKAKLAATDAENKREKRRRSSSSNSDAGSRASSKAPRTVENVLPEGGEKKPVSLAERAAANQRAATKPNTQAQAPRVRPPGPMKKKPASIFIQPKRR